MPMARRRLSTFVSPLTDRSCHLNVSSTHQMKVPSWPKSEVWLPDMIGVLTERSNLRSQPIAVPRLVYVNTTDALRSAPSSHVARFDIFFGRRPVLANDPHQHVS